KLIVSYIRGTDLDEVTAWCHTGFVKVSDQWFGDLARVDCAVGYLNGTVAVVFFVSQLGHYVRLSLNHSNGNEVVVLVPYLGHAELRAHQSLNFWGCGHSSLSTSLAESLMSMLTSAVRARRISESTACGVGSTMSIRRL